MKAEEKMEEEYRHIVNYYETDAMGMVHHSNYVRWMEEARSYMMDMFGYSYKKLESVGIGSPVLSYKCEIKHSTYYYDEIYIKARIIEYNGVRLTVEYEMKKDNKIVAIGETKHCFLNKEGRPVRLNKECEELDKIIKEQLNENIK
jgi:acyl-CoA thioester hydrolase